MHVQISAFLFWCCYIWLIFGKCRFNSDEIPVTYAGNGTLTLNDIDGIDRTLNHTCTPWPTT